MSQALQIEIRYTGKDVADGSMELSDVVGALQGFSNAYTKIVILKKSEYQHTIRINGIKQGSVSFLLEVIELAGKHKEAAGIAVSSAVGVLGLILKVIEITRHTQDKSHEVKVSGDSKNNVVIQNCDKVSLSFPIETYQIYQEGLIKQDLSRICDPLEKGKVDSVKISSKTEDLETLITEKEREYFRYSGEETTKTQEMVLTGSIISLNKETNRGSFRLQDGNRITYKLKTDNPQAMYQHFVHKGLVKVKCIAHLDENLKPLSIDIFDIEELQLRLL